MSSLLIGVVAAVALPPQRSGCYSITGGYSTANSIGESSIRYILVANFSRLEEFVLLYLSRPAIQARIVICTFGFEFYPFSVLVIDPCYPVLTYTGRGVSTSTRLTSTPYQARGPGAAGCLGTARMDYP